MPNGAKITMWGIVATGIIAIVTIVISVVLNNDNRIESVYSETIDIAVTATDLRGSQSLHPNFL